MLRKLLAFLSIFALVVILVFVNYTTPTEIGPFGVLVFFMSLYIFLFGVSLCIVSILRFILKGKRKNKKLDYYYAVIFAFGPIILLLMRAFDVSSLMSVAITILFVFLGCFLIKKKVNVVE